MSVELKQPTKAFALRVLRLVNAMPRAEFAAKLGIAEEEADESVLQLELIAKTETLPAAKVSALHREAEELPAIRASSRLTTLRTKRPSA